MPSFVPQEGWAGYRCELKVDSLCMQANSYSSLPFTVRFVFVRSFLTLRGLGPAKILLRIWSPTAVPFNSPCSWRGPRVGDVFINLKDPGARRTVWTSDACPGDPGQSEVWIRHLFYPTKSRLKPSEFNLLRIYFLNKGPRNWVSARVKTLHYSRHLATRKVKTSSKNSCEK